jgi:hypothetical protein
MRLYAAAAVLTIVPALLAQTGGAPAPPAATTTAGPSAPAPSAVRATYVKPDFGNAYTLATNPLATKPPAPGATPKPVPPPETRRLATTIPVTPEKGVPFDALTANVTAVAIGAFYDPDLLAEFHAAAKVPKGGTPQIEISAEGPYLPSGVYNVTIEISLDPGKAPAATPPANASTKEAEPPLPQRLTLQLTIPAGELKPLTAQTIDRVLLACPWCRAVTAPPVLRVTESTNRTMLTGVTARQSDKLVATNGTTIDATIHSTEPVSIRAGQVGDLPLTIDGAEQLPLGKASTTVSVTANELTTPVLVPFEIRVRLHPWLLLPAILLGVAFGILLRVLLKNFIERGTVQVKAYELIETMRAAARRESDPLFLEAVAVARIDVTDALEGDVAAVTAAVTAGKAALQSARTTLQSRLDTLAASIAALRELTESAGQFPGDVATALTEAGKQIAGVEALWTARNASEGTTALEGINQRLARNVSAAAADWRIALRRALAETRQLPPLPEPQGGMLTTAATALSVKLEAIPVDNANVATILNGVHAASFQALHDIERGVLEPLAEYGETVAERIERIGRNAEAVRKAARALRQSIDADVATTLGAPIRALGSLLTTMREKILAATPDEHQQDAQTLLGEGKYEEAAATSAGGGASAVAQSAIPPLTPESEAAPPWRAAIAPSVAAAAGGPAASAGTWLRWQLALARALNSLGIAILLALAGLVFLYPTFDGTVQGLLTAFFWGYASDFSAEAIKTAKH